MKDATFDKNFPKTLELTKEVIKQNPSHEDFLKRRFSYLTDPEKRNLEFISTQIVSLVAPEVEQFVSDYLFLCEMQRDEEIYFRRSGRYRLDSFQDALDQVYSDRAFMTKYMNGLLLTQIWWSNHTKMLSYYRENFLAQNPNGYSHLEIGPGHGLLLYLACSDEKSATIEAWDISEASIQSTKHALTKMGISNFSNLKLVDMFDCPPRQFDSLVFSEVLEHMERPDDALKLLRSMLSDKGRLYIHVPINSPAPDHLFNTATPDEMKTFIEAQGFIMEDVFYAPATNYTLDVCIKHKLTVSCGFIARKR